MNMIEALLAVAGTDKLCRPVSMQGTGTAYEYSKMWGYRVVAKDSWDTYIRANIPNPKQVAEEWEVIERQQVLEKESTGPLYTNTSSWAMKNKGKKEDAW